MKFKLLLLALYMKMSKAAKKDVRFRDFIRTKQLRITIKTSEGEKGRQYIFDRGKISSTGDIHGGCDAAMVWCDEDTAFKVMTSGNDEASIAALTEEKLQVEGNLKEFLWFSRALDIMMGKA